MKNKIQNIFDKLVKDEEEFFTTQQEFFSPCLPGRSISVKISNIPRSFATQTKFEGYGIFKPKDRQTADFVREANLAEREEYLKLFPRFTAVVYRQGRRPKAVLAQTNYKNVVLNGQIEVLLSENISLFDHVIVRWDGSSFWYERPSDAINRHKEELQSALADKKPLVSLSCRCLSPADAAAYGLAFEDVRDKVENRLNKALLRSGARLKSYVDRGETYTVTYKVDDREITSTVDSKNLQVQSAGICLSGGDSRFDLQTLVNVIREGEARNRIVVGDFSNYPGYAGEDYDDNDY